MDTAKIDIAARRKAAEVYRHFAAGLLTNDQMEDAQPESSEQALHDIFFRGIWPLYDDLHEHKLTGQYHLTPKGREHVARVILFLHGTLPYRWPITIGWRGIGNLLIVAFTFGVFSPLRRRIRASGGDESVWPFFTRDEYESALQHPPFLHAEKCD